MSDWKYWFKQGDEFTPVEFNEDGTLKSVIVGMCLMFSLEEMKKRADKIWEVEDIYNPNPETAKVIWNNPHARDERKGLQ